jgi:hypothetical protein
MPACVEAMVRKKEFHHRGSRVPYPRYEVTQLLSEVVDLLIVESTDVVSSVFAHDYLLSPVPRLISPSPEQDLHRLTRSCAACAMRDRWTSQLDSDQPLREFTLPAAKVSCCACSSGKMFGQLRHHSRKRQRIL